LPPPCPRSPGLGLPDLPAPAGVRAIRSIAPPGDNSNLGDVKPAGDRLMFTARSPTGSYQVWMSDGTAGGTQPIDPSVFGDVAMFGLVAFANGALYFRGWERDGGTELYRM